MEASDPSGGRGLEEERCLRAERLEACLPSLMSYVRRLVGDAEIARDVMQNISVTILTAHEAPTNVPQFFAWCRGVARNVATYERRVRRRSQSMIPEEELDRDRPDPETNPEESTNSRKMLRSLVRELGADEFELLVRRYVLEEDWRIDRLKVCFYTVTDNERFVVEKLGSRGWLMSPCSGHGFKFGAVMGLELARTIAMDRDAAAHARWAAGLKGDKPSGQDDIVS